MCSLLLEIQEVDLSPSFLLVDYPGYGDNKGKPSPSNVLEASELAVQQALSSLPRLVTNVFSLVLFERVLVQGPRVPEPLRA